VMRASKRAARREVQKHIDFTEGHLAKKHSIKGLSESNFRAAAFIRVKKDHARSHADRAILLSIAGTLAFFFCSFFFFSLS